MDKQPLIEILRLNLGGLMVVILSSLFSSCLCQVDAVSLKGDVAVKR